MKYHQKTKHKDMECKIIRIGCSKCKLDIKHNCLLRKPIGVHRFSCKECDHKTSILQNMRYHQRKKHGNTNKDSITRIGCLKCQNDIEHNCFITRPKKSSRSIEGHLKCTDCDYATKWPQQLRNHHNSKHLGLFRFQCSICDFKSFYKIVVRRHNEQEHSENNEGRIMRIGCEKCKLDKKHNCLLRKRIGVHRFSCKECGHKTSVLQNMRYHQRTKHADSNVNNIIRIGCSKCQNDIEHKCLRTRPNRKTLVYSGKYACNECAYKSNKKSILRKHIESIHLNIFKYACKLCDYKTYFSSSMKYHFKTYHNDNSLEENVFNIQNKKHKDIKLSGFVCKLCSYRTDFLASIQYHFQSNHKDYKLEGNIFKPEDDRSTLNIVPKDKEVSEVKSTKLDRSEAPLKCKKSLRKQTIYTGKYGCDQCYYKCNKKSILRKHIESVHLKLSRFACKLCDYKTYFIGSIKYHLKSLHT